MREILFRGKRVDNGEWIEGFFAKSGDRCFIITDNDFLVGCVNINGVIPETVGQNTGFTDKNGTKIFEGDIVNIYDTLNTNCHAVIEFGNTNGDCSCGRPLKPIAGVYLDTDVLYWVDLKETGAFYEVAGNIYDNPELLNDEE